MDIQFWFVAGLIVGALVGMVLGKNCGITGDIVLGIIGGLVGGSLASIGFTLKPPNESSSIGIVGVIGATILITVISLLARARKGSGSDEQDNAALPE